jgi:prepilin-type N-terminal cleavage/methylation domain-containing protein
MKQITSNKRQKAFTLVELLVVIVIIGVISTILVANWRRNEKQYQLQLTAQEIVQNIRKTQDMALTSLKHDPAEPVPENFGIFFNPNQYPFSYRIFADKNGNKRYDDPGATIIDLGGGIEIYSVSPAPRLSITFSVPDGFVSIRQPSEIIATIVIRIAGASCPSRNCKDIIVRNTGQINIQ